VAQDRVLLLKLDIDEDAGGGASVAAVALEADDLFGEGLEGGPGGGVSFAAGAPVPDCGSGNPMLQTALAFKRAQSSGQARESERCYGVKYPDAEYYSSEDPLLVETEPEVDSG